jgi:hypothetical protein
LEPFPHALGKALGIRHLPDAVRYCRVLLPLRESGFAIRVLRAIGVYRYIDMIDRLILTLIEDSHTGPADAHIVGMPNQCLKDALFEDHGVRIRVDTNQEVLPLVDIVVAV